jgi:putative glutamine transport system substrate-binding protein
LFVCIYTIDYAAVAQLKGDSYNSAKANGTANITYTYVNSAGFSYKNSNGEVQGICVDIMNEFAKYVEATDKIKVNLRYKQLANHDNFPEYLKQIKNGQGGVFGLGNITITDERKKSYNFSAPFISNITILISHSSVPSLTSLDKIGTTFAGMKAYAESGTTNELQIKEIKSSYFPDLNIQYVNSSVELLDKIVEDRKSFTNIDFTYYLAVLKQRKPIKRHQVGDQWAEEFGIIMPKSNDWGPKMDEFFNSGFIGGPVYRKIIARHLGENALKMLDMLKKKS